MEDDMTTPEPIDNPASTEAVHYLTGEPSPVVGPEDTGDVAQVPESEQVETDDPEPNTDADDDLADVPEGEVVELTDDDETAD